MKASRSVYTPPCALMVQDNSYWIQYSYGTLEGQYTLSLVVWVSRILPMWLSVVMEDHKFSIQFPLCSDCPVSCLLDSVSLRYTTRSVYTFPDVLMVEDSSLWTQYYFGRLQGKYTLSLFLSWSNILSLWPSIVMEDSVSIWKTTMSVYTLPGALMVQDPSY